MNRRLFAALLLAMPFGANATAISGYGTYARTYSGIYTDTDNAEFGTSASSAQAASSTAAEAYAALMGETYLPELKARGSAETGSFNAYAVGVQHFTYTGSETRTVTLDINLHGSAMAVGRGAAHNLLETRVAVKASSDLPWMPWDLPTIKYESGGELLGDEWLYITDALDANRSASISFDLVPGLDFYVLASLTARASNGFADGWHTVTMSFDDPTGMRAATGGGNVSAVPVPAAAWLFGSGIVGFIGARRRKSQRQTAH